jgi:hypothetical protein
MDGNDWMGRITVEDYMRTIVLTILVVILGVCKCASSEPQVSGITDSLAALRSEDWAQRARAYEKLTTNPGTMRDPAVKAALVDVLDRENHLTPASAPQTDSEEAYAEYISSLLGTVEAIVDRNDPHQVCILAHASYNDDSPFADRLSKMGKPLLPCLMDMVKSNQTGDRIKSAALLVQMRAKAHNLDLETDQQIRAATIRALHDENEWVRSSAVESLGMFGGEDMIATLKTISDSDPAPEVRGYSIRKQAKDAIVAIEKRSRK